MPSRCQSNPGSLLVVGGRNFRFTLVILIWAAIQMPIMGCLSSRSGIPTSRNDSADFGVRSARNHPRAVFIRQTSFLGSNSPDVVKPDQTSNRVPFGQNPNQVRPSLAEPQTIDEPVPDSVFSPTPIAESFPPLTSNCFTFRSDIHSLPARFLEEIDSLATLENAFFLGTAGGIAAVLHNNVDASVARHQPRSGNASDVITDFGDAFPVQLPILGGMYATSLWLQNDELHELTLTMFTTYKFTLLTSIALQYATRTRHSDDGVFNLLSDSGFPSEQTATTFALAAVVDEAYGWQGGLPAYLFAGVIAWAEVDQNQHTVSDVVFGAALGFVIGKSIGALHYRPDAPFKLIPLIDAYSGTQGMGIEYNY